jgi:hypothetical protein
MCIVYLKHLPKPGSLAESALWKLDSENKFKETALQSTPFPPPKAIYLLPEQNVEIETFYI